MTARRGQRGSQREAFPGGQQLPQPRQQPPAPPKADGVGLEGREAPGYFAGIYEFAAVQYLGQQGISGAVVSPAPLGVARQ